MKKILVTGGTGFIGSNLAMRLIERGFEVRILRRKQSDLRNIAQLDAEQLLGDVRDLESLREAMKNCDTVFHTAAVVSFEADKEELLNSVNVMGTKNVVTSCLQSDIAKLVYTSSIAALGYPPAGSLGTEATVFNWGERGGYRRSKFLAEQEIHRGIEQGLFSVIVNPTVVLGERDIHFHGGQLVRDIKRGRIPFYIDGGMNIVYVGDVVSGHIEAAFRGRNGERYILGGENLTHREIFQRTAALIGGRSPFAKLPIPLLRVGASIIERTSSLLGVRPLVTTNLVQGAGKFNWYSSEKAARELGHQPTPFDETILRTYNWYLENRLL